VFFSFEEHPKRNTIQALPNNQYTLFFTILTGSLSSGMLL